MNNSETKLDHADIPQQIIEQFLKQLATEKLPANLIARLKKTLLEKKEVSETEIKTSIFSEDQAA